MRYEWKPYVPVAKRRQQAVRKIAKLKKSGQVLRPVEIEGRKIARTFWGESWCQNLEAYSDYSNRLPRGRTYARNGSVVDLQIAAGRVRGLVSGSSFYKVEIEIRSVATKHWDTIKTQCAGKIDSMVELLQGSISKGVMDIVTRHGTGLFPSPEEISLRCSCPDWATMCKHVAAVLYGVGARLDHEPEMLFTLRGVDPSELVAAAVADIPTMSKSGNRRIVNPDDLSTVFGIDFDTGSASNDERASPPAPRRSRSATAKTAAKKAKTVATKSGTKASRKKATTTEATKSGAKASSAAKSSRVSKSAGAKKVGGAKQKVAADELKRTPTKVAAARKKSPKKAKT